jgi:ribosomal protein S18 acetylase RimI-like enzyme
MNDILQDLSTSSLISAIEGNLFAIISAFRKWPRAEVHDEAEIMWSMTDIPFPLFNSIMRAQLLPERIDAVIQPIIAQAESRNVPMLWWTGPTTQPADLGIHLERHGFVSEGQMPGMAVDLANLNENPPMPSGLTIQRVTDDETLKQWSQVCAAGFGMPDFVANAFYDFMCHVDPNTNLAYLGWRNDQPVATSLLLLAAGVAGIYNVATIPEARRQGIGAMMTVSPLREARDRKYKVGILQASEMGVDVYRSLGFQEYCKIGQYVWSPEHKQGAG